MVVALCLVLSSALLAVVAIALQGPESVVVGLLVTATGIASFLIPAAAVIAIRRYRLYDLDLRAENWRAGTSDPARQPTRGGDVTRRSCLDTPKTSVASQQR